MVIEINCFSLEEINGRICKSIIRFLTKDLFLLRGNVHERSVTHKLAEYLQQEFLDWNVDCEYNRKGVKPKKMGLVMASKDVVAIDSAAAKILGFKPDEIGQIKLAHNEKVGNTKYVVEGEPLDNIVNNFPRKKLRHVIKEHGAKIYFKYLT